MRMRLRGSETRGKRRALRSEKVRGDIQKTVEARV